MSAPTFLICHKEIPLRITGVNSGAEMAVRDLAHFLVRSGNKVVVCAQLEETEKSYEGVQYWDLGAGYDVTSCLERARVIGPYHLIAVVRAQPILESMSEVTCISRILMSHDSNATTARMAYKDLCKIVDAVVAVTKAHKQVLVEAGVSPEKIKVIYNGINHKIFYPPEKTSQREPNTLLFVGALVPRKGLHLLVDAYDILLRENPALRLDVYGNARLWGEMDYIDTGQITQKYPGIIFHGARPQTEIADKLRKASISIIPSIQFETFSLASIEAQACGCPVIAFDAGGIKETMIPGDTGIIVPEISAQELARTVAKYLVDNEERDRLSRNGIEFAKNNFNWTKTAKAVARLCDKISTASNKG